MHEKKREGTKITEEGKKIKQVSFKVLSVQLCACAMA